MVEELIEEIKKLNKDNVIIGIDGRCGSGKTTVARKLSEALSANMISMDDFYSAPANRKNVPGGHIDYNRFVSEVLIPLNKDEDFCYKPYDCKTSSYKDEIKVFKNHITIVEGAYSLHPDIEQYYDLKVFITTDYSDQLTRIKKRGDKINDFINVWIPQEEKYFYEYHIESKCDKIFNT